MKFFRFFILLLATLFTQSLVATTSEWDGISSDISWYDSELKEFHINSAAQLKGLADLVNNELHSFEGNIIYLDTDIDLRNFAWTPIGLSKDWEDTQYNNYHPFKGVFDGNDHTIKNVLLKLSNIDVHRYPIVGLFGYIEEGKIKSLNVQGEIDINPSYVGTSTYIGGVVGKVDDGEIEQISADFTIIDNFGTDVILGIVAGAANKISKVRATGSIKDANYIYSRGEIGGIVGHGNIIQEADSKVSIYIRTTGTKRTYIGGIAASAESIKDVIFTGSNYNHNYSPSANPNNFLFVGGICANLNNGNVINAICLSSQNYVSSDRNINNVSIGSIIPNSDYLSYNSVTNSYYLLNSSSISPYVAINELGTGVSRDMFISGEPLNGFDTNVWLFEKEKFPQLRAFLPPIKYTITYIVDGKVYKEYELKEGDSITPEPEPTKEGYTFSGWSWIPSKMPGENVTVIGSFVPNLYKLTYMVDGVVYKSYDVAYDSPITPEPEPNKEGHTFSGWSYIPSKMPAEDVVVSGTFTVNKYKLTYMVDGEVYKTFEVKYGAAIIPEPEPTKDGYIFSGWSEIPETMPTRDITIYGSFISIKCGDNLTWTYSKDTKTLTISGTGAMWNYTSDSPAQWDNIKEDIDKIVIEDGVSSIGDNAFKDCSNTKSVFFPPSITSSGNSSFYGCTGLTSVHISDLITWCKVSFELWSSNPLYFAHHLYLNGEEIKDLVIPNDVTSIGSSAFWGCSGLTSVTIPSSLKEINDYAFAYCTGLTAIHISDLESWIKIKFKEALSNPLVYAHHLYMNGEEIKDLIIPSNITSFGDFTFWGCSGLNSLTIHKDVTSIGNNVFRECSGLDSIIVEEGNAMYDSRNDCNALVLSGSNTILLGCKNTVIPNSITKIGDFSFEKTDITSIIIPNSVTEIGIGAFSGCI